MSDRLIVVDCETTGLHPGSNHRIIELALVRVGPDGRPVDTWSTLLNPGRDLGPTDIHGIRGVDVVDAPRFEDVVGEVMDRLAGRAIVAHNARFDRAFLEHELAMAEVDKSPLPAVCTMDVARRLGIGGGRMRLADCCEHLGVEVTAGHTAEGDALACAAILGAYLREGPVDELISAPLDPVDTWPRSDRRAPCKRRGEFAPPTEPTFLARLARSADAPVGTNAFEVAPYLDLLDRALEDRLLSDAEIADLGSMASLLGLDQDRVRALHVDYLGTLIALALRDGVLTEREHADLRLVASALGVDGIEGALSGVGQESAPVEGAARSGLEGKSVCFTGALLCSYEGMPMTRDTAERLARGAGLVVQPRVTKKLDVLVVADPHSQSGKTKKAKEYGIKVIAEAAFWPLIGIEVT